MPKGDARLVATERRRALAFMPGIESARSTKPVRVVNLCPAIVHRGMTLLAAYKVPFVEIEPK